MKITIYSKDNCSACTYLEEQLKQYNPIIIKNKVMPNYPTTIIEHNFETFTFVGTTKRIQQCIDKFIVEDFFHS